MAVEKVVMGSNSYQKKSYQMSFGKTERDNSGKKMNEKITAYSQSDIPDYAPITFDAEIAKEKKGKGQEKKEGMEENIESDQQVLHEKIQKSIEEYSSRMGNFEARFGVHESTNRVTIKLVDKDTKEVIKEIPPEKTLDMIAKCLELAGMLVDEKA